MKLEQILPALQQTTDYNKKICENAERGLGKMRSEVEHLKSNKLESK